MGLDLVNSYIRRKDNKMKSPCEGCLKLAICISKTAVECDDFNTFAIHIGISYELGNISPFTIDDYWERLNNILPRLTTILIR